MIEDEEFIARQKLLRRMVLVSLTANFLGPVVAYYFPTPASVLMAYWFITLSTAALCAIGFLHTKVNSGMHQ